MNARPAAIAALLLSVATPAAAHRVDEYLQATILSVEKSGLRADMFLTPGVAVAPTVLADLDADGDGVISPAEQRAYAGRVLRDLSLTLDGERVTPRLIAVELSSAGEMNAGRGDLHLEFYAALPPGGPHRRLRLENHHQSRIAACQVNCLVPRDPAIRIRAEQRNESQSVYELEFAQAGARSDSPRQGSAISFGGWLGAGALLLFIGAAVYRSRTARCSTTVEHPSGTSARRVRAPRARNFLSRVRDLSSPRGRGC